MIQVLCQFPHTFILEWGYDLLARMGGEMRHKNSGVSLERRTRERMQPLMYALVMETQAAD